MGDRVPEPQMFQYIMWNEEKRDPSWMELLDKLSFQMPRGETYPREL